MLGIDLLPWQKWLLIHMLELLPDNSLRFRTVIVLVARQNGKSTLSQVVALWFMYVYRVKLVLGTAQDLDTAEEVWQGAVDLVTETDEDDEPLHPELHELLDKVVMVNGKKSLNLTTGERYKVKAANRRAGRGLSGDLILLDELREHQSWDAWGAITKTTMARAMALILALSNAGDASSVVLRYLRNMAIESLIADGHEDLRAELGDLDQIVDDELSAYADDGVDEAEMFANAGDDSLAIFEWSAPPGCDVNDRDAWAWANPSLGHTITERTIASAAATDPEWIFRTEVLCQWSKGTLNGPFPAGCWEACLDPTSSIAGVERFTVGVDLSHDKSFAHLVIAGFNQRGEPHGEVTASRAGTGWVIPFLAEREDRIICVAGQGKGAPVSPLLNEIEEAGIPVRRWEGPDLSAGTVEFFQLVKDKKLRHLTQPILDAAAATAVPKITDTGSMFWNRGQSPLDIGPLVGLNAAIWALLHQPKRRTSAYESSDLIIA